MWLYNHGSGAWCIMDTPCLPTILLLRPVTHVSIIIQAFRTYLINLQQEYARTDVGRLPGPFSMPTLSDSFLSLINVSTTPLMGCFGSHKHGTRWSYHLFIPCIPKLQLTCRCQVRQLVSQSGEVPLPTRTWSAYGYWSVIPQPILGSRNSHIFIQVTKLQ